MDSYEANIRALNRPFLMGVGSVLDLRGYRFRHRPEPDAQVIRRDWQVIGDTIVRVQKRETRTQRADEPAQR